MVIRSQQTAILVGDNFKTYENRILVVHCNISNKLFELIFLHFSIAKFGLTILWLILFYKGETTSIRIVFFCHFCGLNICIRMSSTRQHRWLNTYQPHTGILEWLSFCFVSDFIFIKWLKHCLITKRKAFQDHILRCLGMTNKP